MTRPKTETLEKGDELFEVAERSDYQGRKRRFVSKERAEEWWVTMARRSPYYFQWYLLGMKPALHHEVWLSYMFNRADPNQPPPSAYLNLIGPRFSAKTMVIAAATLWKMSTAPLSTNAIVSVTADTAEDRLRMLRNWIETDSRYQNVFPHILIDDRSSERNTNSQFSIWSNENDADYKIWRQRVVRANSHLIKNPSIVAAGIGSSRWNGKRIDGVMQMDDLVDNTYMRGDLQDKAMKWFTMVVMPALDDNAVIWNIGVRWMEGDVYEQWSNHPEWKTITIPAILEDETGKQYSYWPEFWPLKRLEERRRKMNDDVEFRRMFLCDPRASSAELFSEDDFRSDWPDMRHLRFDSVIISTDTALKAKEQNDFTVFLCWGQKDETHYLLDGVRIKTEGEHTIDNLIMFAHSCMANFGRLDNICTENVAAQTLIYQWLSVKAPHLPVHEIVPLGDKHHRARNAATFMQHHPVLFNPHLPLLEVLVREAVNFPFARFDDCVDAFSQYVQYVLHNQMVVTLDFVRSPLLR